MSAGKTVSIAFHQPEECPGIKSWEVGKVPVREYTVSQLNRMLKNLIDTQIEFQRVSVKGEVSNARRDGNGHLYFTLKDETAMISAVMYRGSQWKGLQFEIASGQEVVVDGTVDYYERKGELQLKATAIRLGGAGRQMELLKLLRQKLYQEGLFDPSRKKEIPKFAKSIGIVTSEHGDVRDDIEKNGKLRNPYIRMVLYPAKVQGIGAAESIVAGIRTLDKMGLDVIIVGRGGGSEEDLSAFNEEIVARAIAEAETPIISATGHETNFTLADEAADLRVSTPTAAAVAAVPDVMSMIRQIQEKRNLITRVLQNRVEYMLKQKESLRNRLDSKGPEGRLKQQLLRRTQLSELLKREMSKLAEASFARQDYLSEKLDREMKQKLQNACQRAELLTERLNGLSPTAKLVGGFGYISKEGGAIRSVEDVKVSDRFEVLIHDGTIEAEVRGVRHTSEDSSNRVYIGT